MNKISLRIFALLFFGFLTPLLESADAAQDQSPGDGCSVGEFCEPPHVPTVPVPTCVLSSGVIENGVYVTPTVGGLSSVFDVRQTIVNNDGTRGDQCFYRIDDGPRQPIGCDFSMSLKGSDLGPGVHKFKTSFGNEPTCSETTISVVMLINTAFLPTSRSVQVGTTATTYFTAVIDKQYAHLAANCRISPDSVIPGGFYSVRETDPLTNAPIGPEKPVFDLYSGSRSFVFGLKPNTALDSHRINLAIFCDGGIRGMVKSEINTFRLSASLNPVPDIIALSATASGDGILRLNNGVGAFSISAVNVGASGGNLRAKLPLLPAGITAGVCETFSSGAQLGQCKAAPSADYAFSLDASQTATFSVFVSSTVAIPFNPAFSRLSVMFYNGFTLSGGTGVALTTEAVPANEAKLNAKISVNTMSPASLVAAAQAPKTEVKTEPAPSAQAQTAPASSSPSPAVNSQASSGGLPSNPNPNFYAIPETPAPSAQPIKVFTGKDLIKIIVDALKTKKK